jgi:hypothetical protein
MIRSKNPIPTAKEFKYNLRAICIAQYLKKHNVENGCEVLIVPKKKISFKSVFDRRAATKKAVSHPKKRAKKAEPVVPAYRKINSTLGQCLLC